MWFHVLISSFREKEYCINISLLERTRFFPPCLFPLKIFHMFPAVSFFSALIFTGSSRETCILFKWNLPSPIVKLIPWLPSLSHPSHLQWPCQHRRKELGFCSALQLRSLTLILIPFDLFLLPVKKKLMILLKCTWANRGKKCWNLLNGAQNLGEGYSYLWSFLESIVGLF